jgi:hypothetical protein
MDVNKDFKVVPSGNLDKKHFETTYFPKGMK